ncbi:MAG: ABC transporter permease, partial [Bacteroidales bacterium]
GWRFKTESPVEGQVGSSYSSLSVDLYEKYLKDLKSPELVSIRAVNNWEFIFNGTRYEKSCTRTDGNFWKIYDFEFTAGRPFTQQDVLDKRNYAVIAESLSKILFEPGESSLGKTIDYNNMQLSVVGVIQHPPPTALNTSGDIYIPYNLVTDSGVRPYIGGYQVIFKAARKKDRAAIVEEVQEIIRRLDAADDELKLFMPGPNTQFDKMLIGYGDPEEYSGRSLPLLEFLGKAFGFLLLPAINLMALNFSRMRERSEEIGVRKTFGASASVIRKQFIFENIMMTLLGGILGILLSYIVVLIFRSEIRIPIDFINSVQITYSFDIVIFLFALASCLLFSMLSGVLPAIKMSKMKTVEVLRGGEL